MNRRAHLAKPRVQTRSAAPTPTAPLDDVVLFTLIALFVLAFLCLYRWSRRVLITLESAMLEDAGDPNHLPELDETATRLACKSGLREVPCSDAVASRNAWSKLHWQDVSLRVGPDYRRNKLKRPTKAPLLPVVGVDIFKANQKA